jgi:hypothetical protein
LTVFGGIEAGGSKWECAVGTGPDDLRTAETIPTTTLSETIGRAVEFFEREVPVDAVGLGSFGPIDRRRGYITTTPKPGWRETDVAGELHRRLGVPVAFDTDVNAAARSSAASCCTASRIRSSATSASRTTARRTRSRARARSTATAGRDWPPDRLWRHATAGRRTSWTTRRRGRLSSSETIRTCRPD